MWQVWLLALDAAPRAPEQTPGTPQAAIIRWGIVIVVLVIVGGALVMAYRARVLRNPPSEGDAGIDLDDLRALRDGGELTIQEYEAIREKITTQIRQKAGVGGGDLTLPQIREMLDRGELTAAQYEMERKKIMERLKGRA